MVDRSAVMLLDAVPDTQVWFQQPHQVIHKYLFLHLQGITCPLLAYESTSINAAFTHIDTRIHINKNTSLKIKV